MVLRKKNSEQSKIPLIPIGAGDNLRGRGTVGMGNWSASPNAVLGLAGIKMKRRIQFG